MTLLGLARLPLSSRRAQQMVQKKRHWAMQLPAKKNVSTACCGLWQWRPFGFWWAMWSPLCTEELTCFISCICKKIKELRLSCACTMHLLYAVNCKAYFWELRGIPFHCLTSFSFVIQKRTHVDFFFGGVLFFVLVAFPLVLFGLAVVLLFRVLNAFSFFIWDIFGVWRGCTNSYPKSDCHGLYGEHSMRKRNLSAFFLV